MHQSPAPKLSFMHLAALSAIGKLGSVACVADYLNVTASAVSHRVREAERRLDAQLVHRVDNRLVLTEAGMRLVEVANKIILELLQAEEDVCSVAPSSSRSVRIGASSCGSLRWLVDFIDYLANKVPGVKVEVVNVNGANALGRLLEEHIDVLVWAGDPNHPDIESLPLLLDEIRVIVSPSHPWCNRRGVDIGELMEHTSLTREDINAVRTMDKVYFSPGGDTDQAYATAWSAPEPMAELVAEKGGIGVASACSVYTYISTYRVRAIRLTGCDVGLTWHVSTRKRDFRCDRVSPCVEQLLEWWKPERQLMPINPS